MDRAAESVVLNIAEGSTRLSKKSKAYFYMIARGSASECAAILDLRSNHISEETYKELISLLDEISKMLYSLIKNLTGKNGIEENTQSSIIEMLEEKRNKI